MRHQTQPEQMTRLLIQKPVDYAELDENARIAISVLQEDGWTIERIGLEIGVTVTRTPIEKPGMLLVTSAQLEESERQFIRLRREVTEMRRGNWLAAGWACIVCGGLNLFHLGNWSMALAGCCVMVWAWSKRFRRTKGAA